MPPALFLTWKLGPCNSHDIYRDGGNKVESIYKAEQTCFPGDNRILLQIYLQQSCIPGDNRGTHTDLGLVDPRM